MHCGEKMAVQSNGGVNALAFLFCLAVGVGLLFIPFFGWGLGPLVIIGGIASAANNSGSSKVVCPECGYSFISEN